LVESATEDGRGELPGRRVGCAAERRHLNHRQALWPTPDLRPTTPAVLGYVSRHRGGAVVAVVVDEEDDRAWNPDGIAY
jgi:hypothetical protein